MHVFEKDIKNTCLGAEVTFRAFRIPCNNSFYRFGNQLAEGFHQNLTLEGRARTIEHIFFRIIDIRHQFGLPAPKGLILMLEVKTILLFRGMAAQNIGLQQRGPWF